MHYDATRDQRKTSGNIPEARIRAWIEDSARYLPENQLDRLCRIAYAAGREDALKEIEDSRPAFPASEG